MKRTYSHVIVVGIDGAGAFIRKADTPHFDRIFADGAVTYSALASFPTISAECWGSMLLGVGPEVHGLTNNIVSTVPYPTDSPFPSLFRRIREALPEAELGSYCDWNPITAGIVEGNIGVSHDTARDTELTPVICSYIREKKPDFLFIQLDSVDGAGHRNGYGTPAHLERIHEVDCLVSDIHTAASDAGILEDTLFAVIADHGGTDPGDGTGSHGGWTDGEKYVTFAVSGKTVHRSVIEEMNIRDLAAIVLYALGIEAPAFDENGWTAQIPAGIFADPDIPAYRDISHLAAAPRISKEPHTSETLQRPKGERMPDILLKPVDANDAPFICRLMNMPTVLSVLREIPTDLSVWEEAIPLWQADPDEEDLIITLDGQPVGWLGVNGLAEKTAYIKMLVLLPEYQRRGIGAAALMQLLGVLRRRGYADAALYTDEENLSARRCYEKCGFAVTEHLFEEMSDGSFPARVKMERSL